MERRAKLLGQISPGLTGAEIENLALATRRLALLNNIRLPEPQLFGPCQNPQPGMFICPGLKN
jgi:hypothetical protein